MDNNSTKDIFRQIAIGFLVLVALLICYGAIRANIRKSKETTPRYIFLFIGDGMGNSHVCAAESYLSWKAGKFGGEQLTFTRFPELALMSTYSADHQVTCSSASATAFSSGVKTNNGFIGAAPDSLPTHPFTDILKDKGYKIGIMSSVPINHATPAAFYAHQTDRWGYYPITVQLPSSGYDFFAGPGFAEYAGREGSQKPSDQILEEGGYTVCYSPEEVRANNKKPRIVLCDESYRGKSAQEYDINYDSTRTPLSEQLRAGMDYLGDRQPFFIMCEGGEIDWAAHENSVYPMVQAILRFDDAVKVAYEFYEKHPDETLIVVTADHETGGLAIGYNFDWEYSVQDWAAAEAKWIADGCKDTLSHAERIALQNAWGFGWSTNEHTGAPVPVFAVGKGAGRFNGRIDNTDIPRLIIGSRK